MTSTRLARAYFMAQSIGVAAWWLILFAIPGARALFETEGRSLIGFAPGDACIVVLGLYVALRPDRGRFLAWMLGGAMGYGALYTLAEALMRRAPLPGALLMVPAAMASIWGAAVLSRRAVPSSLPPGAGP